MDVFIFKSVTQQPMLIAKKVEMNMLWWSCFQKCDMLTPQLTTLHVRSTPRRFQHDVEQTADALRKVAAEAKIHIAPW